jgi:hypothetical protein
MVGHILRDLSLGAIILLTAAAGCSRTENSSQENKPAGPIEEIVSFRTEVVVKDGGGLSVFEEIKVRSLNKMVRNNLRRWLAKSYFDSDGEIKELVPVMLEAQLDGKLAGFVEDEKGPPLTIKIPFSDPANPPQVYTFLLRYDLNGAPWETSNFSELYLNVTDFWPIPVRQVSFSVKFPPTIDQSRIKGFALIRDNRRSLFDARWHKRSPKAKSADGQGSSSSVIKVKPKEIDLITTGFGVFSLKSTVQLGIKEALTVKIKWLRTKTFSLMPTPKSTALPVKTPERKEAIKKQDSPIPPGAAFKLDDGEMPKIIKGSEDDTIRIEAPPEAGTKTFKLEEGEMPRIIKGTEQDVIRMGDVNSFGQEAK